jgi:hypothetical protein
MTRNNVVSRPLCGTHVVATSYGTYAVAERIPWGGQCGVTGAGCAAARPSGPELTRIGPYTCRSVRDRWLCVMSTPTFHGATAGWF